MIAAHLEHHHKPFRWFDLGSSIGHIVSLLAILRRCSPPHMHACKQQPAFPSTTLIGTLSNLFKILSQSSVKQIPVGSSPQLSSRTSQVGLQSTLDSTKLHSRCSRRNLQGACLTIAPATFSRLWPGGPRAGRSVLWGPASHGPAVLQRELSSAGGARSHLRSAPAQHPQRELVEPESDPHS